MVDLNSNEKMQRWCGYVKALEEERNKILVFQRELPLSLELLTQAIEACKKKTSRFATMEYVHAPSDGSEQTLSEGPLLAHEFISIKRACSCLSDEEDDRNRDHDREKLKLHGNGYKSSSNVKDGNNNSMDQKVDWLRSVQLWTYPKEVVPKELMPKEVAQRNRGAFHPFQGGKSTGNRNQVEAEFPSTPPLVVSSTAEGVTNDGCKTKEETKEGRNQKKQRRSWSLELHKRFLDALQQLGGSNAATPKQIRELMKVDGLTNDEVKSHLQKYRLNIRRPSTAIRDNNSPHSPQYAVAGGIWVPPSQYAAATTNTTTSGETANVINTPVATTALPPSASPRVISSSLEHTPMQPRSEKSEGSRSRSNNDSEDGSQANSLSTSSIHITTVSMPVC